MEIFLIALLSVLVFGVYLLIEFIVPIAMITLIFLQYSPVWLWATILIIWFVARMIVYTMKKGN